MFRIVMKKTKHSKTHLFIPVDSPIISAHIWDLSPPTTSGLSSEGRTSFQNANTSHVPSLASRKNGYCQWHLGGGSPATMLFGVRSCEVAILWDIKGCVFVFMAKVHVPLRLGDFQGGKIKPNYFSVTRIHWWKFFGRKHPNGSIV